MLFARRFRMLKKEFASSFLQVLYVCLQIRKVSRLRARPKGFPIALWKPSASYAMECLQAWKPEVSFFLQVYERACLFQHFESEGLRPLRSGCQKTPGRCRRGRNPSDFHSYPPALPAGRVVDFACKINSLHLRTTSGWPKVLPRKSGENHFFDTLNQRGFGPSDTSPEIFRQSDCMKAPFRQATLPGQNIRPFPAQMTRPAPLICLRLDKAYFRPFSRASSMRCWSRAGFALPPDMPMAAPMSALARFALPL